MTAAELFRAGRLKEAIDAQLAKVRAQPTDRLARFFLFELALFAGDLDRARKQLDVLQYDDPQHSAAVQQYRFALESEAHRRAVFAGTEQPKGLTTAPDHVKLRVEALPYLARGEHAEARRRIDEANAAMPAVSCIVNGNPIDGFYEADERFGTVLEVFGSNGVYSWVPLELVETITMNAPAAPRDVILRPARVVLKDGLDGDVLLPALYPMTHDHPDDEIKLGRATEWIGADGEVTRGAGGKLFLAGDNTIRLIELLTVAVPEPPAA